MAPLTANVTHWWMLCTSALSAFGAAAQPTFQPVVWKVLPNEPITTARSAIAG